MRLVAVLSALLFAVEAWAQDVSELPAATGLTESRVNDLMQREAAQWPQPASPAVSTEPGQPPKEAATTDPSDASPVLHEGAMAEEGQTRFTALEGFAASDAVGHVDDFVMALTDPVPEIRQFSAHVLNGLDPALFMDKVLALVQSEDENTSASAAAAIPLLRDSLEAPLIEMLLREDEAPVRRYVAASALAYMKSSMAIAPLVQVAETADPQLSRTCVAALGAIPDVIVVPQLARLTQHPAAPVRYTALSSLAAVAGPEATAALAEIAAQQREDDPGLSVQAVAYLAERGGDDMPPMMIQIMRQNPDALGSAVGALRRITGEDYGDDADAWERWWIKKQQEKQEQQQQPQLEEYSPFDFQMM